MRARLHRCSAATLHCIAVPVARRVLRGKTGNFSWRAFLRGPTVGPTPDRPAGRSVGRPALPLRFNETRIPIRFDIFIYRFAHLALYRPSASPSSFTRPDKTMVVGRRCRRRFVRYVGLPFKARLSRSPTSIARL